MAAFLAWSDRKSQLRWQNLDRPDEPFFQQDHGSAPLRALTFHPDGDRLIGAAFDGTLILWTWTGADLRETARRREHSRAITDLAISPSGRWLVTSGADCGLKLWDVTGLRVEKAWEMRHPLLAVQFAPDGRHFAAAGNSLIFLFRPGLEGDALAHR